MNWLSVSALEQTLWLFQSSLVLVLQTDHIGPLQSTVFTLWADCVLRLRSHFHISSWWGHRAAESVNTSITERQRRLRRDPASQLNINIQSHGLRRDGQQLTVDSSWWRDDGVWSQTWWMIWLWVRWRLPLCYHGTISISRVSGRTRLKYLTRSDGCDEIWLTHSCSHQDDLL